MNLDLEMDHLFDKKLKALKKTCPNCKTSYYGNSCPHCGQKGGVKEYFEDPDFDEYFKKVEEENRKPIQWEDVPDEDDSVTF